MPTFSVGTPPLLCADDFGISSGVSSGIEELAETRRISATTAIVTLPTWPREALRLAALREGIAIGLHVNLTLGAPLAPMPDLAPSGTLPSLGALLQRCLFGRRPAAEEIATEVTRQIDRFEEATGYFPDFIDGHQHVHVLPGIREGFLRALVSRFPDRRPLVRDPSDRFAAIVARGCAVSKALAVAALSYGFGTAARRAGFPTNSGFSGFSSFDSRISFTDEFERSFRCAGRRHLIMCHPGYVDSELSRLDPVVTRRREELRCLLSAPELETRIWHMSSRAECRLQSWAEGARQPAAGYPTAGAHRGC